MHPPPVSYPALGCTGAGRGSASALPTQVTGTTLSPLQAPVAPQAPVVPHGLCLPKLQGVPRTSWLFVVYNFQREAEGQRS